MSLKKLDERKIEVLQYFLSFNTTHPHNILAENIVMLYYNKIPDIIQRKDRRGQLIPFSFEAVSKSSGDIIKGEGCICTSSYIKTVNVQWLSGEVRKLRKILFMKVNDQEIIT